MLLWMETYGLAVPNSIIEKSGETREEFLVRDRVYAKKYFNEGSQKHSSCGCPATIEVHLEWDTKPAGEATDLVEGDLVTHGLILGSLLESDKARQHHRYDVGDSFDIERRMRASILESISTALPNSVKWLVGRPT